MPLVTLISSDGKEFSVEIQIAKMSETIQRLMEAFDTSENGDEAFLNYPIPLSNVASDVLKMVISWCTRYQNNKSVVQGEINDEISKWDEGFFKIDHLTLFDLILAANYLDIRGLLEASCKEVANMIKGKSPEDIQKIFCIENDLTPDEETQIVKETAWMGLGTLRNESLLSDNTTSQQFPLLDLPNEIVSIVLQQLSTVDRLRSRVNRKLLMLESLHRYWIRELSIGRGYDEFSAQDDATEQDEEHGKVVMTLIGPCSSYVDVLTKFASHTSIESLFFLCDDEERQLIPYIKALRTRKLTIAMGQEMGKEEINDTSLAEWTQERVYLKIQMGGHAVSGDALFNVFMDMSSGLSTLLRFRIDVLAEACRWALHLLGIYFSKGKFSSRRKDAEFFLDETEGRKTFVIIIGSNMKITVSKRLLNSDIEGDFAIERFNEDGSVPDDLCFNGCQSIQDLIATLQPSPVVFL